MKNKFEENQIQTTIANSIQKSKQLALDLNGAISRGNVLLNQFNQMRRQHFLYSDGRLEINDPMGALSDVFQNDITIRRISESLSVSICVAMSYLTDLLIEKNNNGSNLLGLIGYLQQIDSFVASTMHLPINYSGMSNAVSKGHIYFSERVENGMCQNIARHYYRIAQKL